MEDLRERVQALEQVIVKLHEQQRAQARQAAKWRFIAVLAATLGFVLMVPYSSRAGGETVETTLKSPLRVLGPDGSPVLSLDTAGGAARLRLFDGNGKGAFELVANSTGHRELSFLNINGLPQLQMGLSAEGALLAIDTPEGIPAVTIGGSAGGGRMMISKADRTGNILLAVDRGGGGVTLFNAATQTVATLLMTETGSGLIGVSDGTGNLRGVLTADQSGGLLGITNRTNKQVVSLGASPMGRGALDLSNEAGKTRLGLGVDPNGGGVAVFNSLNKPVGRLFANPSGGNLKVSNKAGKPIFSKP